MSAPVFDDCKNATFALVESFLLVNLQFIPDSNRNLLRYLGLTEDKYKRLLAARKIKQGAETTFVVKDSKWKELQVQFGIPGDSFEFSKRKWKGEKNVKWVRLGQKSGKHDNYHAGNQPNDMKVQSFERLEQKFLRSLEQPSMVMQVKFVLGKLEELKTCQREENDGEDDETVGTTI